MEVFKSVVDGLFAACGFLVGVAAIAAFHKPCEQKLRRFIQYVIARKPLVVSTGVFLTILCTVYMYAAFSIPTRQKKEQKLERDAQAEQMTKLQNQLSNQSSQISSLQKQVANANSENINMVLAMAKSPHPILTAITSIVSSSPLTQVDPPSQIDVDLAVSELKNRQIQMSAQETQASLEEDQRNLEANEAAISNSTPIFEYAMAKFEEMLNQVANQANDKLLSNYKGIPTTIATPSYTFAGMKMQFNSNWNFSATIISSRRGYGGKSEHLKIFNNAESSNAITAVIESGTAGSSLMHGKKYVSSRLLYQGMVVIDETSFDSSYRTNIVRLFRLFVGAQAESWPLQKQR